MNAVSRAIDKRPWSEQDLVDFAVFVAKMLRSQQWPKTNPARLEAEADVKRKIEIILRRRAPQRVREGGAL